MSSVARLPGTVLLLPRDDLVTRVGPVIVFFLAITVVAEVADLARVFGVAAHWAARAAHHRAAVLWGLLVVLATACTVVLSLDTTAVLLTPVALAVAARAGPAPLPLAMTTLWLANTASLMLPVSNLTNLIASSRSAALGVGHAGYVGLVRLPALAAVAGTVLVLGVLHRRALSGRYEVAPPAGGHDPVLLRVAAGVCLALAPAFVLGLPPAPVAVAAAVVLLATLAARRPGAVRRVSVPWLMALVVAVLFVGIDLVLAHGLREVLEALAGTATDAGGVVRLGGVAAVLANGVDNLPAHLALEPVAGRDPTRLAALVAGGLALAALVWA